LSGNLKGKANFEELSLDGEDEFHWVLRKKGGSVWTEFIFTRIRTSSESLSVK